MLLLHFKRSLLLAYCTFSISLVGMPIGAYFCDILQLYEKESFFAEAIVFVVAPVIFFLLGAILSVCFPTAWLTWTSSTISLFFGFGIFVYLRGLAPSAGSALAMIAFIGNVLLQLLASVLLGLLSFFIWRRQSKHYLVGIDKSSGNSQVP